MKFEFGPYVRPVNLTCDLLGVGALNAPPPSPHTHTLLSPRHISKTALRKRANFTAYTCHNYKQSVVYADAVLKNMLRNFEIRRSNVVL